MRKISTIVIPILALSWIMIVASPASKAVAQAQDYCFSADVQMGWPSSPCNSACDAPGYNYEISQDEYEALEQQGRVLSCLEPLASGIRQEYCFNADSRMGWLPLPGNDGCFAEGYNYNISEEVYEVLEERGQVLASPR